MKTSRPLYYYPAQLSDPEAEWAYQRLWQLLIPVFMGVMHRLAGPLGPSVGVLVMIVAHAATTPDWQQAAAGAWAGLLKAPWLAAVQLGFRARIGKSGVDEPFER